VSIRYTRKEWADLHKYTPKLPKEKVDRNNIRRLEKGVGRPRFRNLVQAAELGSNIRIAQELLKDPKIAEAVERRKSLWESK
jgi:hypothetical protein